MFKRSIALNPLSADAYFEFAERVVEIGSSHSLRRAIDPAIVSLSGDRKEDYYAKALRYYRHAVLRDPFCGIYHQRLGAVYALLADQAAAEKEFSLAIQADPQNISIHLYLADYYSGKKDSQKHEYHLNKIISIYQATLKGGGPLAEMAMHYFKRIGREDLIQ